MVYEGYCKLLANHFTLLNQYLKQATKPAN
jgi:hypothetical protein